ncbi:MAG: GAF domain-containing protein [Cruoricaptor ignavus]|nr:GAF domain-containing protein [Cruoricaptor ignavus]
METIKTYFESPVKVVFCFEKYLKTLAENTTDGRKKALLKQYQNIPELKNGSDKIADLEKHKDFISEILEDVFPKILTDNEIKAVSFPLCDYTFNYTNRFKKILEDGKTSFKINIEDINEDEFYIFNCCFILQKIYGVQFMSSFSTSFQARDKEGILRHYKISINVDFAEVLPTEKSQPITQEDIDELRNNFDDMALWKKKFPPESWLMKGFAIISLTDTTSDTALSHLKSVLLGINIQSVEPNADVIDAFVSYYNIPDINIGFIPYDEKNSRFNESLVPEKNMSQFVLDYWKKTNTEDRQIAVQHILYNPKPFLVADIYKLEEDAKQHPVYNTLIKKNINSFIILPIVEDNQLLGIMEISSQTPNTMNAITLKKSEQLLPFLRNTILRFKSEIENRTEAIIQREYTTIHPSIRWRFREEAEQVLDAEIRNQQYKPKEIIFKNLHPFFGQIDIVASSIKREKAILKDMLKQLKWLKNFFEKNKNTDSEKYIFAIDSYLKEIENDPESRQQERFLLFINYQIHPFITANYEPNIFADYFSKLNTKNNLLTTEQDKLDLTIDTLNTALSVELQMAEQKAQEIFPNYFAYLKSDGIEYNLLVGESIAPKQGFSSELLPKFKLWQLETIFGAMDLFNKIKPTLPYPITVAGLTLAYNEVIGMKFRMDEKRFDIEDAASSRYEIIKKRLEKALIKNTTERLTQAGKIAIVYLSENSKEEYLSLIKMIEKKLGKNIMIENLEIENLQGITGLKALRISGF